MAGKTNERKVTNTNVYVFGVLTVFTVMAIVLSVSGLIA